MPAPDDPDTQPASPQHIQKLNDSRPRYVVQLVYTMDGPLQAEVNRQVVRDRNAEIDRQIEGQHAQIQNRKGQARDDFNRTVDRRRADRRKDKDVDRGR